MKKKKEPSLPLRDLDRKKKPTEEKMAVLTKPLRQNLKVEVGSLKEFEQRLEKIRSRKAEARKEARSEERKQERRAQQKEESKKEKKRFRS